MIDHFGINCSDLDASARFYDEVLGILGYSRLMDFGVAIGYGNGHPQFWITGWQGTGSNREIHVAFQASGVEQVRAFHATAMALGAESLHEPRLWPEYHEHYFGAFVRDPDGNNVEAVFHRAPLDA